MPAGRFRHRVKVQAPADPESEAGVDAYGEPGDQWTDVSSTAPDGKWAADVRFLSGREAVSARQTTPEATHTVIMRFGAPATPAHRLVLADGRVLGVISAGDPTGKRQQWDLVCQERVGGQG